MKLLNAFVAAILLPLLLGNVAKAQEDTNTMRCVKLTIFFPLLTYDGNVADYDTGYAYIYSYGNQLMYYMSRTHFELGRTKEEVPKKKQVYHRLVFTKGQDYGNYYNDWQVIFNKKVRVDSILKEESVGTSKIDMDTVKAFDTLVYSNRIPGTDTLLEVHRWKGRADTNIYGTTSLYFIPFKPDLPHSIDSVLEKERGMTLCKAVIFTHVGYMAKGVFRTLEFYWRNETQEIPITNRDELMEYFMLNRKGQYFVQLSDVELPIYQSNEFELPIKN